MLSGTHKGPPIISVTTWSNHSHFLPFFLLLKCFKFITPSLCFPTVFIFIVLWRDFLLLLQWFPCSRSLLISPLSLCRSALIRDDGLQPFFMALLASDHSKEPWLLYHPWDSRPGLILIFMLPRPMLLQDLASEILAKQCAILVYHLLFKTT